MFFFSSLLYFLFLFPSSSLLSSYSYSSSSHYLLVIIIIIIIIIITIFLPSSYIDCRDARFVKGESGTMNIEETEMLLEQKRKKRSKNKKIEDWMKEKEKGNTREKKRKTYILFSSYPFSLPTSLCLSLSLSLPLSVSPSLCLTLSLSHPLSVSPSLPLPLSLFSCSISSLLQQSVFSADRLHVISGPDLQHSLAANPVR